jgi:hypothetical protein
MLTEHSLAVVDVQLTVVAAEALRALTAVAVHLVETAASILARLISAVIEVLLTVWAPKAERTLTGVARDPVYTAASVLAG